MRLYRFILCASLFFLLFSCAKEKEALGTVSPKFHFSSDTIFTSYPDTLLLKGNFRNGFRTDSIIAGDTAFFSMEIDGVFNKLLKINITLSNDTTAELLFVDKQYLNSIFLDSSDYEGGVFYPASDKVRLPFMFQFHAKKPSKDLHITLTATSDTDNGNSTSSFKFNAPIGVPPKAKFSFPNDTVFTEKMDTLCVFSSQNFMDSVTVGDVVNFKIQIDGGRYDLKDFKIGVSNRDSAEIILPDKSVLDELFSDSSDYEAGIFYLEDVTKTFYFPFQYQAKLGSGEAFITFETVSNAIEGHNKSKYRLRIPVKEKD